MQATHYAPDIYSNCNNELFNNNINRFLKKSEEIALQAKGRIRSSRQDGYSKHIGCVGYGYPSFNYAPTIISVGNSTNHYHAGRGVSHSPGRSRRDDDRASDGLRVIAGIVAVVVGGISLFVAGQTIGHIMDANTELKNMRDLQKRDEIRNFAFGHYSGIHYYGPHEHCRLINDAAVLRENIFKRIRLNAMINLAMVTTLVAASAVALTGAFVASTPLIAAGTVIGLAVGGAALFKWGFNSADKRNARDGEELLNTIYELKNETAEIRFEIPQKDPEPSFASPNLGPVYCQA